MRQKNANYRAIMSAFSYGYLCYPLTSTWKVNHPYETCKSPLWNVQLNWNKSKLTNAQFLTLNREFTFVLFAVVLGTILESPPTVSFLNVIPVLCCNTLLTKSSANDVVKSLFASNKYVQFNTFFLQKYSIKSMRSDFNI